MTNGAVLLFVVAGCRSRVELLGVAGRRSRVGLQYNLKTQTQFQLNTNKSCKRILRHNHNVHVSISIVSN